MKIISYVDMFDKDINLQVDLANEFSIKDIILSYVSDEKLVTDLELDELKELSNKLRKLKVNVYAVDPKIDEYNINDDLSELLLSYEKAFIVSKELRSDYVIFKLPNLENVFNDFNIFKEGFINVLELAKKYSKTILIDQGKNKNANITYIFNHLNRKEMTLLFSPKQITLNDESSVVGYRTLKQYFNNILVQDIDSKNNPELIGYGKVGLLDLFKRMGRDKFHGNVILDYSFYDFLSGKEKKVSLFQKLLKRDNSNKNYLRGYGLRIFPNEEGRIPTIKEVYLSQISALKIIFDIKN